MKLLPECSVCKCKVGIPDELFEAAIRSSKVSFHCAYGHAQHFPEDGLRRYWAAALAGPAKQIEGTNVILFKPKESNP